MGRIVILALASAGATLLLGGCATGVRGSPRRVCAEAGYQPGTQQFTDCWHRVRDQMFATEAGPMAVGLIAGIAATKPPSAPIQAPVQAPVAASGGTLDQQYVSGLNRICVYSTVRGTYSMTVSAAELCPLSPR